MTPAASAHDGDLSAVVAGEAELLRPECRADAVRLRELLHADFLEHGASGTVWTRDSVVADLVSTSSLPPQRPERPAEPVELQAYRLAPEVILVTYRLEGNRLEGNRPSLRSSVWVRGNGRRWQLRFHQGTPLATG